MALQIPGKDGRGSGFIHGWMSPSNAYILADGTSEEGYKPDMMLYYYPHSINCLKVMMALHEKSIPYTKILVNINLGHQFHEDFLKLNPKGEVPVLRDRRTGEIYVDSDTIIANLNKLYLYRVHPKYVELNPPNVSDLVLTHALFLEKFRKARIETLTNGSVMFDESSLGIKPNYPFDNAAVRNQMREILKIRMSLLMTESKAMQKVNGEAAEYLRQKAVAFQKERPFMVVREKYEQVILEFENLLDECEAQLISTGLGLWLIGSRLTQVDFSFSMLLYRLWQLGFGNRFWTLRKRPNIFRYFEKVKQIPSFKMVAHMDDNKVECWPFIAGAFLCACVATYEVMFGQ